MTSGHKFINVVYNLIIICQVLCSDVGPRLNAKFARSEVSHPQDEYNEEEVCQWGVNGYELEQVKQEHRDHIIQEIIHDTCNKHIYDSVAMI